MIIKTLQWNIGGGKTREPGDDYNDDLAYKNDDLGGIIETIRQCNPDIITLQESHSDQAGNQAEKIAKELGLSFWVNDAYAKSHLEEGQRLSQAIIARYPVHDHAFELFLNPELETIGPKGDRWLSHDKGATSCRVELTDVSVLNVKTSHSVPYRKFGVDPFGDVMTSVRNDMMHKLKPESDLYLYQGDLNYDDFSVKKFLPDLFETGVEEVVLRQPTTPKGRKYDHVLYGNIRHITSVVLDEVLTDHFPVFSEFEI